MAFELMTIHTQGEHHTTWPQRKHCSQVDSIMISIYFAGKFIANDDTQYTLETQTDGKSWSIAWHINRPDFDILLMSNCKYNMDINTWGQWCPQLMSQKVSFLTYGWWLVNINCCHQFDVNSIFFSWKVSTLYIVLVMHVCLSIRALVEVKHTIRI